MASTSRQLVLAVAVLVALVGCGSDQAAMVAEPGDLRHVHDFALDEDGVLLAASHTGLYRIEGPERAVLVGTERHDLMAMAMRDSGDLLASGHPDLRLDEYRVDGKQPHLGLVESVDMGRSWTSTGLLGEADFHALAVTEHGVFAAESTGGLLWFRSSNGSWEQRGSIELDDIAVDPSNADRVVGTGHEDGIALSEDGGWKWSQLDRQTVIEIEWPTQGEMYGVDQTGKIWMSTDPAAEWAIVADGPAEPETFWIDGSGTWWLSVHGGDIWRSDDVGDSWLQVYRSLR